MKSKNEPKTPILRNGAESRRNLAFGEAAETKRRPAKEALRESKERFRILVETIKDWIWEVDPRGVYTYVSPMELIVDGLHLER
jgi:PAS domain-containing protein